MVWFRHWFATRLTRWRASHDRVVERIRIRRPFTINWDAWTAAATIGLLGWAIYTTQFSDLANEIRRNDQLTTKSDELTRQQQTLEIENLNAVARNLQQQARINESTSHELAATAEAANLDKQVSVLSHEREALIAQKSSLTSQIGRLSSDVNKTKAAVAGGIATVVSAAYNTRLSTLVSDINTRRAWVIPTSETVPDNGPVTAISFAILSRTRNFISERAVAENGWYDTGRLVVRARKVVSTGDDKSVAFQGENVRKEDKTFQQFISLLNSPAASSPGVMLMTEFLFDVRPSSNLRVVDVLDRMIGSDSGMALIFMPGNLGGMTHETTLIRMFWLQGLGDAVFESAGVAAVKKGQSAQGIWPQLNPDSDKGTLTFSALDSLSKLSTESLGEDGYKRFHTQVVALDEDWVRFLVRVGLPLALPANGQRGEETMAPIYQRWQWTDSDAARSATLFKDMIVDQSLKNGLLCLGSYFIATEKLGMTANTSAILNSCHMEDVPEQKLKEYVATMLGNETL